MSYTFDANIVSDLHKDAYGYRPTSVFWIDWNNGSDSYKQKMWDYLLEDLDAEMARERDEQASAVFSYETQIANNIALGAADRATAIRWMMQSMELGENDLYYGGSLVCYKLGLPYHMETEFDDICKQMLAAFQKEAA